MTTEELYAEHPKKPDRELYQTIIVGGGIIGLSIARELKKCGVERLLLIDKKTAENPNFGFAASRAAAGMLAPQAEADQPDDFFRLCSASRDLYPEFARELEAETGINIELNTTGTLYLAFNEKDAEELEKRFAWQRAADLPVEKLSWKEILELEPNVSERVLTGLRFPLDWQVENRQIVAALAESQRKNNLETISAEAQRIVFRNGRVERVEVLINERVSEFYAPVVVLAAGAWSSQIEFAPELSIKPEIAPVRGQMIKFSTGGKLFRHTIYSPRGYAVPRSGNKTIFGATVENAGFDNRTTASGIATLLETAFEISPEFQDLTVVETWSGLRPRSLDNLPLLGEFPKNSGLHFAAGHYRNGILLAPLTAKIVAEQIAGVDASPFLQIFNPNRFLK